VRQTKQALIYHLIPRHRREETGRRGQSLVEFALVLPVLLLIVAGTLEVANVLTMQNRVQQAAREGARFGAAGGTEAGIATVVGQAAEESLAIDPDRMTIWVIRPVINTDTNPWSWEDDPSRTTWGNATVERVFGNDLNEPLRPIDVLEDMKAAAESAADANAIDETRFVVVVVRYRAKAVLNMPFFQIPDEEGGLIPLWTYSIMQQEVEQETIAQLSGGCSAYPIAIDSAWFPPGIAEDELVGPVPRNDEESPYREGFQFLAWRVDRDSLSDLISPTWPLGSLVKPGNCLHDTYGFLEYDDDLADDMTLHRGDWVVASNGGNSTVGDASDRLDDHSDTQRTLRVIVYDYDAAENPRLWDYGAGPHWLYRIDGFAVVQVTGYDAGADTITFRFVRWDNSCGFD
jgi:hypothetical protein